MHFKHLLSLFASCLLLPYSTYCFAQTAVSQKLAASDSSKTAAKQTKPLNFRMLELELSGLTSRDLDQINARVRHEQTTPKQRHYIRAGYRSSTSKVASEDGIKETHVGTFLLDGRYAKDRGKDYTFYSASANLRFRERESSEYPKNAGYYLVSGGIGKKISKGVESDLALGVLSTYDGDSETDAAMVASLRARLPFSSKFTFDGRAYGIFPVGRNFRLDTDLALSYKLTDNLYVNFGWSANNLVKPTKRAEDWDLSNRLSFLYRKQVSY